MNILSFYHHLLEMQISLFYARPLLFLTEQPLRLRGVGYRKSEYRYQTKYQSKTRENPKPNQLKYMREMPTFYRIHRLLKKLDKMDNTSKIPKTLGLKYKIPSWYRFGIGIPKS